MNNVYRILNEIANTSSRNDKERILTENKDNLLLKDILNFVYSPYILTGISTKKINKKVKNKDVLSFANFYEVVAYLKTSNTGTDMDIVRVQNFISQQPQELQDLYKQIFTKELKIGVTEKTLNKIYGDDFIPTFSVMLAASYFDNEAKVKGDFLLTTKIDGSRLVLLKEDNRCLFFTRQGQPVHGLVEIEEEAKQLPNGFCFDGELVAKNPDNLDSKELFNKTMKISRKDGEKVGLNYILFDMLPIEDFKKGICKTPCIERKTNLKLILDYDYELPLFQHIKALPVLYIGNDKEKMFELLDQARNSREEGLMLNIVNAPYSCKRTKDLLKLKVFIDADMLVTNIIEGTGKNVGKLGAITVKFISDGQYWECNCGSGFSDEQRVKYWNNKELLLNKIVTIKYFEITDNQQGTKGLRFPTFEHIREDKTEISMF